MAERDIRARTSESSIEQEYDCSLSMGRWDRAYLERDEYFNKKRQCLEVEGLSRSHHCKIKR